MTEPWIYSVGTQVVIQKDAYRENGRVAHPAGAVGVVVRSLPILNASAKLSYLDELIEKRQGVLKKES